MESLHTFLFMGGYGAYVWSAYGIAAVVLITNAVWPAAREKQLMQDLAQQLNNDMKSRRDQTPT